ncbi:MAG: tRNA (adenosine(37)-N6)-threonylcarbamoyltransferase complex ATPase subunit type 1 TsaE [Clostridia bacterium]|nr:tRNA (adenosine(37)-N6)-threonylcarbamoyltransferase complex ATPase subunit type 1 TsaE [Clostridia bacterium]
MYITRSSEDTFTFGRALGKFLKAGDTVLLYGDLGCGKSVLARGIAASLGVKDEMASPTFTIMQPYQGDTEKVYHFDLYRLSSADELFAAGLCDHIASDGVALVEWPQQADLSPDVRVEVDIYRAEDFEAREIEIALIGMDERADEILLSIRKWEEDQ